MEINLINNISYLSEDDKITELFEGYSGAKTYCVEKVNGKRCFLKLINGNPNSNVVNFEYYEMLKIPAVKLLEHGTLEDGTIYLVEEWIDGLPLKKYFDEFGVKKIYEIGKEWGESQRKFLKLFPSKVDKDFYQAFIERRKKFCDKVLNLANEKSLGEYSKKLSFIVSLVFDHFKYFENSPVCYTHSDIKAGNLMIDKDKNVYQIDIEDSRYNYLACTLIASIPDIFVNEYRMALYNGYVNGYYDKLDENFNKQVVFIYLLRILEQCNDALKKDDLEECKKIIDNGITTFERIKDSEIFKLANL